MATASLYGFLSGRIKNLPIEAGSLERPFNVAVAGSIHRFDQPIANGANAVVYNDQLSDFKVMFLLSDFDVRAKITNTAGSSLALPIAGQGNTERYGAPLTLGDDTSGAGNTINTVQVFNTSGNTAQVVCIVIK